MNLATVIVTSILLLATSGPVKGQVMKDNPKCKNWNSVVGAWIWEEESRERPGGEWIKVTNGRWQASWLFDGTFLQWRGENDNGVNFFHVFAYDTLNKTHKSAGFTSNGWRWTVTSADWSGTTFTANWIDYTPEGIPVSGRCVWDYAPDFNSATTLCDQFTGGTWWTFHRFKGRKEKAQ